MKIDRERFPFPSTCKGCERLFSAVSYVKIEIGERSICLLATSRDIERVIERETLLSALPGWPTSYSDVTVLFCDLPECPGNNYGDTLEIFSCQRVSIAYDNYRFITRIKEDNCFGIVTTFPDKRWIRGWCVPTSSNIVHEIIATAITDALVMLIPLGILPLHAVVVSRYEKAIVLFGDGGSGKTSTALLLLQHGFQLVCDDRACLIVNGSKVQISGVPAPVRIRPEMRLHCVDLWKSLLTEILPDRTPSKLRLSVPVFAGKICYPDQLLFCEVMKGTKYTTIRPLAKSETYLRLMQGATRLPHLKYMSYRPFERYSASLGALAESTPAYSASLGCDTDSIIKFLGHH